VQPSTRARRSSCRAWRRCKAHAWKDRDAYTYGLHGTPTTFALESRIATLEGRHARAAGAQRAGGAATRSASPTTSTVRAAPAAATSWQAGAVSHAVYDPLDAESLRAVLTPQTRLVWLEAAGSVTLEFPDLLGLMRVAREAAPQAVVALDNTWGAASPSTPLRLRGLAVDLTVHALTKYPSGGGDVLMGSVCTRDARSSNDWRPRTAAAAWAWAPTMWSWCCATCRPCRCATRRRTRLRAASPSGRAICRA
jgi:cystathionine beta-lyase/cystathionine gamma-synthase